MSRRRRNSILTVVFFCIVVVPVLLRISGSEPEALEIADADIPGYRISYEVVGAVGTYERTVTVRRPFDVAVVDRFSMADGALRDRRTVSSLGFRAFEAEDGQWEVAGGPFFAPLGELRSAGQLAESLPDYFVDLGESARVGRGCNTYRVSGSPYSVDELQPVGAAVTYSEVCADGAGVILAWRDVVDRETITVGRAVEFEVLSTVPNSTFAIPEGATGFTRADSLEFNLLPEDSPFVDMPDLDSPEGWTVLSRYLLEQSDSATGTRTTRWVTDVWKRFNTTSWVLRPPLLEPPSTVPAAPGSTTSAPNAGPSRGLIIGPSSLSRTIQTPLGEVVVGTNGGREALAAFIAVARR